MHIHPPRPLHGWREFVGEVGIIVLGVLIALSAEQTVEWLHWRHKTHLAIEAIARELAQRRSAATERIKYFSCVERRLDELGQIVDEAEQNGYLKPLGLVGQPPIRDWASQTWTSVQGSDTSNHFSTESRSIYGGIYSDIADIARQQDAEFPIWTELQQLSGPGRRFDMNDARSLRLSIGRARLANRFTSLVSSQLLDELREGKLALPSRVNASENYDHPTRERTLCKTIGHDISSAYGQAPLSQAIPLIILKPNDKGPPAAPAYSTE